MNSIINDFIREIKPLLTQERRKKINDIILQKTDSIVLILEEFYDVGNIQALLRSAEGLGVLEFAYIPFSGTMKMRQHSRISKGTKKWLLVRHFEQIKDAVKFYRNRGYKIICTSLQASKSFYDLDFSHNYAFILGNELNGASETAHNLADELVFFPMRGFVDSFNVSVAGSLFMHHTRFMKETVLKQDVSLSEGKAEKLKAMYYFNSLTPKNREFFKKKFNFDDIKTFLGL